MASFRVWRRSAIFERQAIAFVRRISSPTAFFLALGVPNKAGVGHGVASLELQCWNGLLVSRGRPVYTIFLSFKVRARLECWGGVPWQPLLPYVAAVSPVLSVSPRRTRLKVSGTCAELGS